MVDCLFVLSLNKNRPNLTPRISIFPAKVTNTWITPFHIIYNQWQTVSVIQPIPLCGKEDRSDGHGCCLLLSLILCVSMSYKRGGGWGSWCWVARKNDTVRLSWRLYYSFLLQVNVTKQGSIFVYLCYISYWMQRASIIWSMIPTFGMALAPQYGQVMWMVYILFSYSFEVPYHWLFYYCCQWCNNIPKRLDITQIKCSSNPYKQPCALKSTSFWKARSYTFDTTLMF